MNIDNLEFYSSYLLDEHRQYLTIMDVFSASKLRENNGEKVVRITDYEKIPPLPPFVSGPEIIINMKELDDLVPHLEKMEPFILSLDIERRSVRFRLIGVDPKFPKFSFYELELVDNRIAQRLVVSGEAIINICKIRKIEQSIPEECENLAKVFQKLNLYYLGIK